MQRGRRGKNGPLHDRGGNIDDGRGNLNLQQWKHQGPNRKGEKTNLRIDLGGCGDVVLGQETYVGGGKNLRSEKDTAPGKSPFGVGVGGLGCKKE